MGTVRLATLPINMRIAKLADARFRKAHLRGSARGGVYKLNVCNREHDDLRRRWIDIYADLGGKVSTSDVTHDCSTEPKPALVSVFVRSSHPGEQVAIELEAGGASLNTEVVNTNTSVLWTLPASRNSYRISCSWVYGYASDREDALREIDEEIEKLEKEYRHWKEYVVDNDGTAKKLILGFFESLASEPYGADPSGFIQQEEDEARKIYLTRIRAIARYRRSVEDMRKTVLEHNRYASAEVRAIPGVIQHITLDIEILPDHKSLLAKTPRIFDKYK